MYTCIYVYVFLKPFLREVFVGNCYFFVKIIMILCSVIYYYCIHVCFYFFKTLKRFIV